MTSKFLVGLLTIALAAFAMAQPASARDGIPERPLFGDTHLHSYYSYDSYTMGNRSGDPDLAYRFAKGLPVTHPSFGTRVRIGRPLDFLAVVDHAEYLGATRSLFRREARTADTAAGRRLLEMSQDGNERLVLVEMARSIHRGERIAEIDQSEVQTDAWIRAGEAADRHYQPGRFTTLIGWEWTGFPRGASLHRVVLLKEGSDVARQFRPFSAFDSQRPEDLWAWLEKTAERTGATFIAIPHNPNESMGRMFAPTRFDGGPMTAEDARMRARWEPVVEVTQTKGDSETHPSLSPEDQFADFERWQRPRLPGLQIPEPSASEYIRPALVTGLALGAQLGVNPFRFGMIGSSDIHTSLSTVEEEEYTGTLSIEGSPSTKTRPLQGGNERGTFKIGNDFQAAGLAAVWATENTREAIFAAFKRREVYATTGPRISLRMFGGWGFRPKDAVSKDLARIGYTAGVPMGADLPVRPKDAGAPRFLLLAEKDPEGANLDRLQVIKGWIGTDGKRYEKIYDAAWSDARRPGPNGVLPSLPDTVDKATAQYINSVGAARLSTVWQDPDFDPGLPAFYYVRALQIHTPRHTLYDSVAARTPPPEGHPATIQERAYSSPIWFVPTR
ncbi:MAG: DUF3604 domain-containing protein [Pseudomonadales bacterium]